MPTVPNQTLNPRPLGSGGEGIRTQKGTVVNVFSGVDTAGDGTPIDISGMNGAITLEIIKSGAGTCNIEVEHTVNRWDTAEAQNQWGDARMMPGETPGFPTPVAGPQAVAGGAVYQSWMLLETFPTIRVSVETVVGAVDVQARLYMVPT